MNKPLLPKATAIWLIDNTTLTFEQIADFCGLHTLEVQGIADGEVAKNIIGINPIVGGQVTKAEVERCEKNSSAKLHLSDMALRLNAAQSRKSKSKYTPVARRQDKPDAISWLLRNCPELSDAQVVKLIGTTKSTIAAVRDRTHWNTPNLKPKDPVLLGLCSQFELDKAYEVARKKAEAAGIRTKAEILDFIEEESKE